MSSVEAISKGDKEKSETREAEVHYNFPEYFETMEIPMTCLVESLKEGIDKQEYDTLISDDAKARLVTLTLREIFKNRINELNPDLTSEEGRNRLKTYFVAGGYGGQANDEALRDFFNILKKEVKNKALLITELTATGESIARMADLLGEAGVNFDIATLINYSLHPSLNNRRVIIGVDALDPRLLDPELVPFYSIYDISGVRKVYGGKSAHPAVYYKENNGIPADPNRQAYINKAREDIKIFAKEIYKKVWKK